MMMVMVEEGHWDEMEKVDVVVCDRCSAGEGVHWYSSRNT